MDTPKYSTKNGKDNAKDHNLRVGLRGVKVGNMCSTRRNGVGGHDTIQGERDGHDWQRNEEEEKYEDVSKKNENPTDDERFAMTEPEDFEDPPSIPLGENE
jgi:hypothetical protein